MDNIYFFWNTFNLVFILTGIYVGGIAVGGLVHAAVANITQTDDSGSGFFFRALGLFASAYLFSPIALEYFREFTKRIWAGDDLFR